ncbi:hypothetical protein ACVRW4_03095 [Streptococcus phocae subsp. phocae]|uniref:Uncharacterized protein n=1 Tax=Streptococcus phocae TaxID=119224 RepID=A0A0P6S895_9STRE|nr:hypothetical protein [Streptococcus phocae]KPJ22664.1 hypothetical protein AKK44_03160 [Streptococcus phocae]
MMKDVTFEGKFDSGYDFYTVEATVPIDITKASLDAETIAKIVEALENKDKQQRGKDSPGECVGFEVSLDDIDQAVDQEKAKYIVDGNFIILDNDYRYLKWFAHKKDIKR